jgi:hypothetical protein
MSTEENKALVRRFWQAGNEHSLKVFDDLMTTDYIQHDTTGDMSKVSFVVCHQLGRLLLLPGFRYIEFLRVKLLRDGFYLTGSE